MKTRYAKLIALPFILLLALAFQPCIGWAADEAQASDSSADLIATQIALDALGDIQDSPMSAQAGSKVNSSVAVSEYSGATMYETAVAQAKAAYPNGSSCAIIVGPGNAWIDALSASGLSATKGPILFSEQNRMNSSSLAALKSLGVKSVVIIGGTIAVGTGVEADLRAAGITIEERIWGEKYYDTQVAILNYGIKHNCWNKDLVILATGSGFADALSISPVAYAKRAPIFVADTSNGLTAAQKAAWGKIAKEGYGKQVAVVGGPLVISEAARSYASTMRGVANGSGSAEWIWGQTKYDTSAKIAEWAVSSQGFSWNNVAFTTGAKPWDALAGSSLQGRDHATMLLTNSMYDSTLSTAGAHKGAIKAARIFGGKTAMPPNVRMGIADKLGFPAAALPNFKLYLDAGHGYNDSGSGALDPGAIGSGYWEYNVNKELAGKVAAILRNQYGVNVFLNDDGGPYRLRHAEAVSQGCDAILSIHFNAGGGTGSESLIHSYNANEYSSRWQSKIHPYLINGMGLANRGQKTQEVAILGGQLPAVLLEICFIDNWSDMQTYQARKDILAMQLALGVVS